VRRYHIDAIGVLSVQTGAYHVTENRLFYKEHPPLGGASGHEVLGPLEYEVPAEMRKAKKFRVGSGSSVAHVPYEGKKYALAFLPVALVLPVLSVVAPCQADALRNPLPIQRRQATSFR
jgi:hypothetical protein